LRQYEQYEFSFDDIQRVYSENSLIQILDQTTSRKYLWHIALPKSGSTWLTRVLSTLYAKNHWEIGALLPYYGRRNQEVDPRCFLATGPIDANVFFVQQHCVYSEYTQFLIERSRTQCILQVRNIFDALVSAFDHLRKALNEQTVEQSLLPRGANEWEDAVLMDYVIDMEAPWYIRFLEGWLNSPLIESGRLLLVRYEALLADPERVVADVLDFSETQGSLTQIKDALGQASKENTRLNQGVAGRGVKVLNSTQLLKINRMIAYCNIPKKYDAILRPAT